MKISGNFLLRLGLAIVFLYAATASFVDPESWIGYFPSLLRMIIPSRLLLSSFSIYEIFLALWLIWGKWPFLSALLSALSLLGIVVFNFNQMDIVFRDVGLIFMALALMLESKVKPTT